MSTLRLQIDSQTELRLIDKQDAPEFFALIEKNRTYLRQWLGWLDVTHSIETCDWSINISRIQRPLQKAMPGKFQEFWLS